MAPRASLNAAGPSMDPGVDRIAHQWFVERLRSIELAGRTGAALETALDRDIPACLAMLNAPPGNRSFASR